MSRFTLSKYGLLYRTENNVRTTGSGCCLLPAPTPAAAMSVRGLLLFGLPNLNFGGDPAGDVRGGDPDILCY